MGRLDASADLNRFDGNHDGQLDLGEFTRWYLAHGFSCDQAVSVTGGGNVGAGIISEDGGGTVVTNNVARYEAQALEHVISRAPRDDGQWQEP